MFFFFFPARGHHETCYFVLPEQQDHTWLSCQSADEQKLFISVLRPSTLESVSCTKAVTYLCQNQHGSHHLFYKSFVSKPWKDTSPAFFLLFQPLADEARGYISAGQWWIDVDKITNTRYEDNQLVAENVIWPSEKGLRKLCPGKEGCSHC